MTSYSSGGFYNHAYHDSETLEVDRRSANKTYNANPYPQADPRINTHYTAAIEPNRNEEAGRWQEEGWWGGETIPMEPMSTESPSQEQDQNQDSYKISPYAQYYRSPASQLPSLMSDNMLMRFRGQRNNTEKEKKNLVRELVSKSTRDRSKAIKNLQKSLNEKREIRDRVLLTKSTEKQRNFIGWKEFTEKVSPSLRRFGYNVKSARQTLELWRGTMKEIGAEFGTSVLSYFVFLKWLFIFNIFSFIITFCFITIPRLVDGTPIEPQVNFTGLELLTGGGYFGDTVLYYGGYINGTVSDQEGYDMRLAYFFTITIYMLLCGLTLIFSMTSSFMRNYVLANPTSNSAWPLLSSWDFNITDDQAVIRHKKNLREQLEKFLSEEAQNKKQQTISERLTHFCVSLGSWFLSTSLAVCCAAGIFYVCLYEKQLMEGNTNSNLLDEAKTLLVPFVVSLANLVVPLFYSLFKKFELDSSQETEIYTLVARHMFLKMSILGVLCFHWINNLAEIYFLCWESMVGQALYRMVIVDFIFQLLGSFFGEFLSKQIGTKVIKSLGVPEFDVARNVLELIYAQTLAWIGIYFCPLLPVIQILKFFILFYVKKASLTVNCQPPKRSGRTAQMQTIFIALLFFPCFAGAISIVGYTIWSLTPSEECGPFHHLNNTFSVVEIWMDNTPEDSWVVWIYTNVIKSEIFYFLLSVIIIVIIYIFGQITQGRKKLIKWLRLQISIEGNDKILLLDRLQRLTTDKPKTKQEQKKHTNHGHSDDDVKPDTQVQAPRARKKLEKEKRSNSRRVPAPSNISSPSPVVQVQLPRQTAEEKERDEYYGSTGLSEGHMHTSSAVTQVMQARRREQEYRFDEVDDQPSSESNAMMQVQQARQRTLEEEDRLQWAPFSQQNTTSGSSSALIQAMFARQQAQNEYDDGY